MHAGYNALGAQAGVERLGCWAHARRKFVEAQKVQPKGKTGRADIALNLISKLYGIETAYKEKSYELRKKARQDLSCHVMEQLREWLRKTLPYVTTQTALGKAVTYLANNWEKFTRYVEEGYLPIDNNPAERAIRPFVMEERTGCSAIRPKARRLALNFTAWSRPPRPTATSPMRGYATHLSAYQWRFRLRTTKPCCRGAARRHRLGERTTH